MFKSVLKLIGFVLLVFVVVEQSYRFYASGTDAFFPERFNSYNQLMLTDLIELSPHPEVYYQLKPGLDRLFRGKALQTNSAGLADTEYSREKPADTFRVAVIGSSWTMATGVQPDGSWHRVLERRLADAYPDKNIEIISFAVEMYGLRELVGTVRHRALAWNPDLLLVSVTAYTAYMRWDDPASNPPLPEPTTPMLQSYLLRAIDARLGTGIFPRSIEQRPTVGNDMALYNSQVVRAFGEIGSVARDAGVPTLIMWLSFNHPGQELEPMMTEAAAQTGVHYFPAYRLLMGEQSFFRDGRVSRLDKHPNAESQARIADGLLQELTDKQLLTGVE